MAAPVDQRIAVPIDDPNADTEWNDILRKHGIIPEKPPSPTPLIEEDETFLEQYRQKRMQELSALQQKSVHGSVYPISKPEYARAVTEASQDGPVFVNLTSAQGGNVESRVLSQLWRQAAQEYGDIKFCEMRADKAIEGYPERNCPTILVYDKGDIVKQVVTLATVGGVRMSMLDLDKILIEVGAVKDNDMRVLKRRRAAEDAADEKLASGSKGIKSSRDVVKRDDDDDDWD